MLKSRRESKFDYNTKVRNSPLPADDALFRSVSKLATIIEKDPRLLSLIRPFVNEEKDEFVNRMLSIYDVAKKRLKSDEAKIVLSEIRENLILTANSQDISVGSLIVQQFMKDNDKDALQKLSHSSCFETRRYATDALNNK